MKRSYSQNTVIVHEGKAKTVAEWAAYCGIGWKSMWARLQKMSESDAIEYSPYTALCEVEGCLKPAHYDGRTHCNTHHYRIRRNGTMVIKLASRSEVLIGNAGELNTKTRKCEKCGSVFFPRLAQIRKGQGRYCSHKCAMSSRPCSEETLRRRSRRGTRKLNLEKWTDSSGYVWHRVGGKRIQEHRAVAELCLGRKLLRHEVVHHINRNPSDNRIENLQVMSRAEHMLVHKADRTTPTPMRGSENHFAKLSEIDVRLIRESKEKAKAMAQRFGVTDALIYMIRRKVIWRHVA